MKTTHRILREAAIAQVAVDMLMKRFASVILPVLEREACDQFRRLLGAPSEGSGAPGPP